MSKRMQRPYEQEERRAVERQDERPWPSLRNPNPNVSRVELFSKRLGGKVESRGSQSMNPFLETETSVI